MSKPLEVSDPAGSVDWKAAEAYMTQGTDQGDEADAGSAQDAEVREFKYRGKTVKVDPATYAVLEDLRKEARGANGRLGSELARTRERLAKLEGVLTARPPETKDDEIAPPDPLLATRDIAAWQRQYDAYHAARTARQMKELEEKHFAYVRATEERAQVSARDKEWADRFYAGYDHLDHPDIKPIVSQVYIEHKAEIDAFGDDVEGAHEHLAELADARLVRLAKAGKDTETNNGRRPPRIESSAGPTPRKPPEDAPREFSAASWVARQRLKMQGREPKQKG